MLQDAFYCGILLRNKGELVNDQRDSLAAGVIANILESCLPITENTEIITRIVDGSASSIRRCEPAPTRSTWHGFRYFE